MQNPDDDNAETAIIPTQSPALAGADEGSPHGNIQPGASGHAPVETGKPEPLEASANLVPPATPSEPPAATAEIAKPESPEASAYVMPRATPGEPPGATAAVAEPEPPEAAADVVPPTTPDEPCGAPAQTVEPETTAEVVPPATLGEPGAASEVTTPEPPEASADVVQPATPGEPCGAPAQTAEPAAPLDPPGASHEKAEPGAPPNEIPKGPLADEPPAALIVSLALSEPPELVADEDPLAYEDMLARTSLAVKPADFIEEIWVREVVDMTWDIKRLRRQKPQLLASCAREGLAALLSSSFGLDNARALSSDWAWGKPEAIKYVKKILADAGMSMDAVLGRALALKIDVFERIDHLIMDIQAARNAELREIDRHRATLGERLRQAVQQVEDAEFKVVEPDPDRSAR
jgi:hypothetical protein